MAAGTSLCSDTAGTILVESSSSESAEGGDATFDDGATCTDMEMATTAASGELTRGGGAATVLHPMSRPISTSMPSTSLFV